MQNKRIEYGDWQTNYALAKKSCDILKDNGFNPTSICEPTCGKGSFIKAALDTFENIHNVYAIEIYTPYIEEIKEIEREHPNVNFYIYNQSVFDFDFSIITDSNILFIGNPPWVTNSELGSIGSSNLPSKSNFKKQGGLESITGKGNFDIAEFILLMIIQRFSLIGGSIAMLVKNSVIKNIVQDQIRNEYNISQLNQYEFNAFKEFGASTNASMFVAHFNNGISYECRTIDLYTNTTLRTWGVVDGKIVSNIDDYKHYCSIDGECEYVWRSGLKHDCSKVMEFTKNNGQFINGLKEICNIEEDLVYPLVKSSDIKSKEITTTRKYVLLTQKNTNDNTELIRDKLPKTYNYLLEHAEYLDTRKSVIYKKRPRFCIFGIGDYSFKPYRVIISGLYKNIKFSLASSINEKLVLIDDTCYSIGFSERTYAEITRDILNSDIVIRFIESISFSDAKRNINKDLLMRINLASAAHLLGYKALGISRELFEQYISFISPKDKTPIQTQLFA